MQKWVVGASHGAFPATFPESISYHFDAQNRRTENRAPIPKPRKTPKMRLASRQAARKRIFAKSPPGAIFKDVENPLPGDGKPMIYSPTLSQPAARLPVSRRLPADCWQ